MLSMTCLLLQMNLLFSLSLLVLLFFAGGLLHNPLVEGEYQQQGAGGGELVEGTQNIAYAFPPCLAGLQREEVEGTHEQGEQQDAWDKVQWEVDDGVEEVDEGGS
ncbi:hypothetical protein EDD16DRAFT_1516679 [Pisolithus croceorrhizus]|nr:hypothetical protein EDD16DRAFT_1516679 [Pisolithus croceorrhizus]